MDVFDGDVLMKQENDGGEIEFINGQPVMTGGFENATYLSFFGGNEDDDGSKDNPLTYWGNFLEDDPSKKYISETQYLLRGLPATSANLIKIEEAMKRDLQWFLDTKTANKIEVLAIIPALNKINLSGSIFAQGKEFNFNFTENWKAMSNGA